MCAWWNCERSAKSELTSFMRDGRVMLSSVGCVVGWITSFFSSGISTRPLQFEQGDRMTFHFTLPQFKLMYRTLIERFLSSGLYRRKRSKKYVLMYGSNDIPHKNFKCLDSGRKPTWRSPSFVLSKAFLYASKMLSNFCTVSLFLLNAFVFLVPDSFKRADNSHD